MGLVRFAEGVWLDTHPVRFIGMPLTVTMSVLRLGDGALLLYSPIALTAELRSELEALGRVAHLYVPNLFHDSWIAAWAAAFPAAKVRAPPSLASRRRGLRVDRVHATSVEPDFSGLLEEKRILGFRVEESVLVYRPARTLMVADLVHNIGCPRDTWTQIYARAMGFYGRVALSRMIRWTGFSDRRAARRSVDELLAFDFDRLVVGHGSPLSEGGKMAVAESFEWLAND